MQIFFHKLIIFISLHIQILIFEYIKFKSQLPLIEGVFCSGLTGVVVCRTLVGIRCSVWSSLMRFSDTSCGLWGSVCRLNSHIVAILCYGIEHVRSKFR